ncbi:MAG: zinc-binding dehydrogenase [Armatimonadota bacterium]|nr:MAG: zinc-binding dehydrogenase [Armatimonadota bacterium]
MSRTALAIVNVAPNRVELQEVGIPDPGPADVAVLTRHSMISNGTERSVLAGERGYGRAEGDPDAPPFPQVGGYQKVGIVESVGRNVRGVAEGDWVFAALGRIAFREFPMAGHVGVSITNHNDVLKLPAGLDPVAASGLVLTQVGYNHGSRPPVSDGTRAIVVGDGLVGLWAAETLQARGAAVLLIGRHDERLRTFEVRGDSRTANARLTDADQVAADFSPGGAHVVIDTLTTADDLHASLRFLAHDGHIVAGGYYIHGRHLIDYMQLTAREATLYAPGGWTRRRLERTLDWIVKGHLRVLDKITHRWPVARAAEAYDLLVRRHEPFLAMVIDW